MGELLQIFLQLTKIPHCSRKTSQMREFLINFAIKLGYDTFQDRAGNLLFRKQKTPILALQCHYDMVCVGRAPEIEVIREGEWLRAVNSSLGADNGAGMAVMLKLMEKYPQLEYLFTNDEEVGLVGATNLELEVKSPYLINLDSDFHSIIVGSAGGEVVQLHYPIKRERVKGVVGELALSGLPGGHSGEDIDKNIPNAILELVNCIEQVVELEGGEHDNSIPTSARAQIVLAGEGEVEMIDRDYLPFLRNLPHGVIKFDSKYRIPSQSVNFAKVKNGEVTLFYRGNTPTDLEALRQLIESRRGKASLKVVEYIAPWSPEEGRLAQLYHQLTGKPFKVIHAGLECGVLKEKFPHLEIISTGTLQEGIHSTQERLYIPSLEAVYRDITNLIPHLEGGER
jgi:dipeptidase D